MLKLNRSVILRSASIFMVYIFSAFTAGTCIADYDEEYDEAELPYVEIQPLTDFSSVLQQARSNKKVIMLEMSASYCGYCKTLEEEIIKPMLRSNDYDENVIIRKLDIDAAYPVGQDEDDLSPAELAQQLKVMITPTLIFLDGNGQEVSQRIPGVYSLDFFGGYVDEAINNGLSVIRSSN